MYVKIICLYLNIINKQITNKMENTYTLKVTKEELELLDTIINNNKASLIRSYKKNPIGLSVKTNSNYIMYKRLKSEISSITRKFSDEYIYGN